MDTSLAVGGWREATKKILAVRALPVAGLSVYKDCGEIGRAHV
jgi:hypothetical protein